MPEYEIDRPEPPVRHKWHFSEAELIAILSREVNAPPGRPFVWGLEQQCYGRDREGLTLVVETKGDGKTPEGK